jgi:hypothetical protein
MRGSKTVADKKEGTNFFRAIGFGLLGALLVVVGFTARGMVADSSTPDTPKRLLGPNFTGVVAQYVENESMTLKDEDGSDWHCRIDKATEITTPSGAKIGEGALVQVKYRGGDKPVAKIIRVLESADSAPSDTASPADTATPSATQTPTASATPAATATP